MKIEYLPDSSGWSSLVASPMDFDSTPPVHALRWSWPQHTASADRLAVASALAFAPWSAGRMDLPQEFSALTAQRIQEWFSFDRIWISPTTIRVGGLPMPAGHRILAIEDQQGNNDVSLTFVTPTEGTAFKNNRTRLSTNVDFFQMDNQPRVHLLAKLALAVLIAEHLSVSVIHFAELQLYDPALFTRTARLLESTGLGLAQS